MKCWAPLVGARLEIANPKVPGSRGEGSHTKIDHGSRVKNSNRNDEGVRVRVFVCVSGWGFCVGSCRHCCWWLCLARVKGKALNKPVTT